MLLIDARGGLVSKEEILNRVWMDTIVDESNIHTQIAMLRRALGARRDLIQTHPGSGYRFLSDVSIVASETTNGDERPVPAACRGTMTNLPEPLSELVEREADLVRVADLIAASRLVTLTGPGGIGKTRLAIEAARGLLPVFEDGVWIAALARVTEPELVAAAVAGALGIELLDGADIAGPCRGGGRSETPAAGARQLRTSGRCGRRGRRSVAARQPGGAYPGDQP